MPPVLSTVQLRTVTDLKPVDWKNNPVPPRAVTRVRVTLAGVLGSVTIRSPPAEFVTLESTISTGSRVAIRTAGAPVVETQQPEYEPPATIVIGEPHEAGAEPEPEDEGVLGVTSRPGAEGALGSDPTAEAGGEGGAGGAALEVGGTGAAAEPGDGVIGGAEPALGVAPGVAGTGTRTGLLEPGVAGSGAPPPTGQVRRKRTDDSGDRRPRPSTVRTPRFWAAPQGTTANLKRLRLVVAACL
jgi:hypothetical protein